MKTRNEARADGDLFYHGRPHECGSTKRYVSSHSCADCTFSRALKAVPKYADRLQRRENKLGSRQARQAVMIAIKRGALANLKKVETKCTDCGARATQYDHRDYNLPLQVEPVCRRCNLLRGPAIAMTERNKRRVSA